MGYAIRERGGKQATTFLGVTWYFLQLVISYEPQNWISKKHKKQIWLWCNFVGYTHPPLSLGSYKITISIKKVLLKMRKYKE